MITVWISSHFSFLRQRTEVVLETLVFLLFKHVTWLIDQESSIILSCYESFRSCIFMKCIFNKIKAKIICICALLCVISFVNRFCNQMQSYFRNVDEFCNSVELYTINELQGQ
jgi:hypothetical protein